MIVTGEVIPETRRAHFYVISTFIYNAKLDQSVKLYVTLLYASPTSNGKSKLT
jgi:hypothetical protein